MKLDVSSLERAVGEMGDFLEKFRGYEASDDVLFFRMLQAGVIKAFEFTYELSVRFIRRQLSQTSFNIANVDALDFRNMMRVAADAGLIAEPKNWFKYREKRNITSHTYDEYKAQEVLAIAGDFLEDARFLLAELTRRNAP